MYVQFLDINRLGRYSHSLDRLNLVFSRAIQNIEPDRRNAARTDPIRRMRTWTTEEIATCTSAYVSCVHYYATAPLYAAVERLLTRAILTVNLLFCTHTSVRSISCLSNEPRDSSKCLEQIRHIIYVLEDLALELA
jgi:hypothetical protein